jgi:hypothetical protein
MKVAIVFDRLNKELLDAILELYPNSDLFSLLPVPDKKLAKRVKRFSFIKSFPFAKKKYKQYTFLMPIAVETFDLSNYDLVISLSEIFAKGVLIHPGTIHIAYILRSIEKNWRGRIFNDHTKRRLSINSLFLTYIRMWDKISAARVDYFIVGSEIIKKEIKKYFQSESITLYPPIDRSISTKEEFQKKFKEIIEKYISEGKK